MLRVGLTGGIGAGKSTVAARLAGHGAVVVDADRLAREVVAPGTEGLGEVVRAFGDGVLQPDGSLDRPALGRLVFADEQSRLRLNAITHPRIAQLTAQAIAAAGPEAVIVHDVPLLVENRMGARYHLVAVVDAPAQERVHRLVTSRGLAEADAWARVRAQADDAARRAAADVWLDNAGAGDALLAQVDALWADRLVRFDRNLRLGQAAARPDQYLVVGPDPDWPAQAARLLDRIGAALAGEALRLDHVGSTAVPGLVAKDVLDLQAVLPSLAAADALQPALATAGYVRCDGDWWDDAPDGERLPKRLYRGCDPGRAVNLHLREASSPAWSWMLLFRDWLREHPAERDAYGRLKASLSGADAAGYVDGKAGWVGAATDRARAWARATGWTAPESRG